MADGTIDMTLESQVCSLELAKRLKELGVKQESVHYWCDPSDGNKRGIGFIRDNHVGYKVYCSAFTVAELGEMLPIGAESYKTDPRLAVHKNGKWQTNVYVNTLVNRVREFADTEADARAKTLVYLLENKLIAL